MKVAIMQPYVFPYLGYFQLVQAVETFVFYDDVNFTKRTWINRNRILMQGREKLITFPCESASQNKLISETEVATNHPLFEKQLRSIEQNYKKAPFFNSAFPLVETILTDPPKLLSELAIKSVKSVFEYLEVEKNWMISSESFSDTKGLERANRLIAITKRVGASNYINAAGGKELYSKNDFAEAGITLQFLNHQLPEYNQFSNPFVAGLSMIDVLMFNSKEAVRAMLEKYELS